MILLQYYCQGQHQNNYKNNKYKALIKARYPTKYFRFIPSRRSHNTMGDTVISITLKGEKAGAQRSQIACPRSTQLLVAVISFEEHSTHRLRGSSDEESALWNFSRRYQLLFISYRSKWETYKRYLFNIILYMLYLLVSYQITMICSYCSFIWFTF